MKKRIFGLRAKFAVLFLLFAVIIMFSVGAVTYRTYRSSMMKRYASEAVTIAKLAASYLDGDELVRYSITRERDEEYDRLEAILDNIKEQSGVLYLYVVKPVSEDSTVYLFDAAAANETNYLAKLGHRRAKQRSGADHDSVRISGIGICAGKRSYGNTGSCRWRGLYDG